jgi:hypothetical protein
MPMGSLLLLVFVFVFVFDFRFPISDFRFPISDFWVSDFVAVVFVAKAPMPFLHVSL